MYIYIFINFILNKFVCNTEKMEIEKDKDKWNKKFIKLVNQSVNIYIFKSNSN